MDIAQVSMALANIQTQNSVGTAVLSKALDNQEIEGNQVVNMIEKASMERSVNPAVGGNIDIFA